MNSKLLAYELMWLLFHGIFNDVNRCKPCPRFVAIGIQRCAADDLSIKSSTYPCRIILVSIPLAEAIINVQHPRVIENVRSRPDVLYADYLPPIISAQLRCPYGPTTCPAIV